MYVRRLMDKILHHTCNKCNARRCTMQPCPPPNLTLARGTNAGCEVGPSDDGGCDATNHVNVKHGGRGHARRNCIKKVQDFVHQQYLITWPRYDERYRHTPICTHIYICTDEVSRMGHPKMHPPRARPRASKSCRPYAICHRG